MDVLVQENGEIHWVPLQQLLQQFGRKSRPQPEPEPEPQEADPAEDGEAVKKRKV